MKKILNQLGIRSKNEGSSTGQKWLKSNGERLNSVSPVDGKIIASVLQSTLKNYNDVVKTSQKAFSIWRTWTAPKRGEVVRQIGEELRKNKSALGQLVSYEMGKSLQEGLGEVQEMIDIADFAVGLSRQLYGLSMHSERPEHRMMEQWHPLGVVGIISAFNFPVAVWSWNSFIAWVCGDTCIWKPSEKTPLTALACQNIVAKVFKANRVPEGVSGIVIGDKQIGQLMSEDQRLPLISATGSTRMGKSVGTEVAKRLGRSLLELGGNNAIIVTENADLNIALTGSVFGAVGTAGQRCTTTRRIIIHRSIYETFKKKIKSAYKQIKIGNPLKEGIQMGPLIDQDAVEMYKNAIQNAKKEGGKELVKGGILEGPGYESGCYVMPCIIEVPGNIDTVRNETFAPIVYLMPYDTLEEAIALQNDVPQGLSSSIFTLNMREAELFLSARGSDCGIANVNIGTSGAEIGGAFGGEKETGGGRESGS